MKVDLNTIRLTELTNQLEAYSQEESPEFRKLIDLLISISILFNRTNEKRQDEERTAANERRAQVSNELAGTYKSFANNNLTPIAFLQTLAGVAAPAVAPAVGTFKGLIEETIQGKRTVLNHSIEKIKMFGDDLGRDAQRSQSHVSELFGLRKQMDNDAHNTASRMT